MAIEQLVRKRLELPGYTTLDRMVARTRAKVNEGVFGTVTSRIPADGRAGLTRLLVTDPATRRSEFDRLKDPAKAPTIGKLKARLKHLADLDAIGPAETWLAGVPMVKIGHFAGEARLTDAADQDDQEGPAADPRAENNAGGDREDDGEQAARRAGVLVLKALEDGGGLERLSAAHEAVAAHHGNNYLPLLERYYKSHRPVLFTLVDALELEAASAERGVLDAVEFIRANRDQRGEWIEESATCLRDGRQVTIAIDIDSFASEQWRRRCATSAAPGSWPAVTWRCELRPVLSFQVWITSGFRPKGRQILDTAEWDIVR